MRSQPHRINLPPKTKGQSVNKQRAIKGLFISLCVFLGACASTGNSPMTNTPTADSRLEEVIVTGEKRTGVTSSNGVSDVMLEREIVPIVGNLYRARNNNHYTIFLVTSQGVILADPINTDFSKWLKDELEERFDSTVKYVLYSHHHYDHASGGSVFADTADFVGHENMLAALAAPLPSTSVFSDKNSDGMLQRNETGGGTLANFDRLDSNGDNQLTGAEMNVHIVPPNLTYSTTYSVYLGGMEVQMLHSGESHSNDGSILYFGEEAVAYAVDWLNLGRLPGSLYDTPIEGWIESIDKVIALDPTRIAPGHGEIGYRADLFAYKQYFVDLKAAVDKAIYEGVDIEEFVENLELKDYKHWERYGSHLALNATEAYALAKRE